MIYALYKWCAGVSGAGEHLWGGVLQTGSGMRAAHKWRERVRLHGQVSRPLETGKQTWYRRIRIGFNVDPDLVPDPGFWWPKSIYLKPKIAIYHSSLGLHKERTSYGRRLWPTKENIQHFKTWHFFTFFSIFVVHFSRPAFGSMRIRIRICNTRTRIL
jgi:hypothetical protein